MVPPVRAAARHAAHRPPAGQRQGRPRGAGRAAPHPERAQRVQRPVGLGPVLRPHRPGRAGSATRVMWVATFVLMGRAFALYGILGHEAAHRLLFSKRWANDGIGRWGLVVSRASSPSTSTGAATSPTTRTRWGPRSPTSTSTPTTRSPATRWAASCAATPCGISGWKNLKGLFRGAAVRAHPGRGPAHPRHPGGDPGRIFTAFGRPELYPLLWLAPWMTGWRVINRLRAIAEHGGMIRSGDRRETTHHVTPDLAGPLLDRPVQHRLAPGPPRRHGRAVPAPAPASTTSWWPPAGSCPTSSTPTTAPSGRASPPASP